MAIELSAGVIMWLVGGACGVSLFVFSLVARLSRLELKTETIWDFLIRRAVSEGLGKGALEMNSPVRATEAAKQWIPAELRDELQRFYASRCNKMSLPQLMMAIEREYGDIILREVCIPRGLASGACLVIAAEVAKDVGRPA